VSRSPRSADPDRRSGVQRPFRRCRIWKLREASRTRMRAQKHTQCQAPAPVLQKKWKQALYFQTESVSYHSPVRSVPSNAFFLKSEMVLEAYNLCKLRYADQ